MMDAMCFELKWDTSAMADGKYNAALYVTRSLRRRRCSWGAAGWRARFNVGCTRETRVPGGLCVSVSEWLTCNVLLIWSCFDTL